MKLEGIKFSIRLKFIIFVLWGIFILSLIYSVVYLMRSRMLMETELSKRGELLASNIAYNSRFGVLAEDKQFLGQIIDGAFEDADIAYVVISNKEGKDLSNRFRTGKSDTDLETVLKLRDTEHAAKVVLSKGGTVINLNDKVTVGKRQGLGETEGTEDSEDDVKGFVQIGINTENISKRFRSIFVVGMMLFFVNLLVGSGVTYYFANRFLSPISVVTEKTLLIADGDLTQKVELARRSTDEVGLLANTFNRMSINLNEMLKRIQESSDNVTKASHIVATSSKEVFEGSQVQNNYIEDTSKSVGDINEAIKGIAENLEILSNSAEESSSSILELSASIEEVAENMESLSNSVEETTSSVVEMATSIKEVAGHINELFKLSDNTASAVNQMEAAVKQVEGNTKDTARISEEAMKDAEEGVAAVEKSVININKVYDVTVEAAKVISSLGDKAQEIGNVLNVIDDVAEETNLLALNAAIIAAQAGEHGRGFAVVADEIKDLAERTAASTKEISQLIRTVQDESRKSVKTVNIGLKMVEEGVTLSQKAGEALRKVNQSSHKTRLMSTEIAKATSELVKGTNMITDSIEKMVTMAQEISKATSEQTQGSEQIMKAANKMKEITIQVKSAIQEQSKGGKHITQATENIRDMVNYINNATQSQNKASTHVVNSIENIKKISQSTVENVAKLDRAVGSLSGASESLQLIVTRFKI